MKHLENDYIGMLRMIYLEQCDWNKISEIMEIKLFTQVQEPSLVELVVQLVWIDLINLF